MPFGLMSDVVCPAMAGLPLARSASVVYPVAEPGRAGRMAELLERPRLDLAHPLPAQLEPLPEFLQGARLAIVQPKAGPHNGLLPGGEGLETLRDLRGPLRRAGRLTRSEERR